MKATGRRGFNGESSGCLFLRTRQLSIELVRDKILGENLGKTPSSNGLIRVCAVGLGAKNEHRAHYLDADQGREEPKPAVDGEPLLLKGELRLAQLVVLVHLVET